MVVIVVSVLVGLTGLICIGLGISLMGGNISLLHDYHRSRVEEKDIPALGKAAGKGMILVGISIAAYGGFLLAAALLDVKILLWVGMALLVIGMIPGILCITRAVNRYNQGMF